MAVLGKGALIGCVCFVIPIIGLWLPLEKQSRRWSLDFHFLTVPSSIVLEFLPLGSGGERVPFFGITIFDIAGGIVFYAIIGAVIGYLYGKVKTRNK